MSTLLILAVTCLASLFSPAISQTTCSSQNVQTTGRTAFSNCMDLPFLDSYLHYSYNATNSSLSVAFVGTQSQPTGWVAWAINPTKLKMDGSQAFLAFRSGGGPPVVRTYNISGYTLNEGPLAFESWDVSAESMTGNRIVIHASVKVPAGAGSVNQVWQIGGNVTSNRPGVHPFTAGHLNSTGVLSLAAGPGASPTPTTGGSTVPGQAGGPPNAGSITTSLNYGVNLGILILLCSLFVF